MYTLRQVAALKNLFPVRVVQRFIANRGGSQAVLIAWNALTTIFPIALALVAIGGVILGVAGISADKIASLVANLFPPEQQHAAVDAINGLKQQTGLIGLFAIVGFLWAGSALFGAMEEAFGAVYGTEGRPFVRQKLMALAMMGLFTVLAVVAVASSTVQSLLDKIPSVPSQVGIGMETVVGILAGCVLFLVLYFIVPNRRQHLRTVWPGALFAGLAFKALTLLFPLYIELNKGINRYGSTFAFLFILTAFFYFFGLITMVGVEINAVLEERQGRPTLLGAQRGPDPAGQVKQTAE